MRKKYLSRFLAAGMAVSLLLSGCQGGQGAAGAATAGSSDAAVEITADSAGAANSEESAGNQASEGSGAAAESAASAEITASGAADSAGGASSESTADGTGSADNTASSDTVAAGVGAVTNDEVQALKKTATTVQFDGSNARIDGGGAAFADGVLTISKGGTYVLSGELNGQILLDTNKQAEVTLILSGLQVTSEKPYAICSVAGKQVTVILEEGTKNALNVSGVCAEDDGSTELTEEQEADAAIYVKNDLVLTGGGSMEIVSAGKAVHSKDTLTAADGSWTLSPADDALNGKDAVTVNGGSYLIQVTDAEEGKGLTSRGDVVLNDGIMKAENCNEGIEGLTITVNGGSWELQTLDDGINAREKQDTEDERAKMMNNEKVHLVFNGGTVVVNAGGDGLDSNGDIVMNGGLVIVSSSEGDGDNAIDMNGDCRIDGGTIVATGMQGMAAPLSDESKQNIITVYFKELVAAGTELSVKDATGDDLLKQAALKSFNCLQISLPEFMTGETYTVSTGSESYEVKVEAVNSSAGERTGGFGGHGGFGGQRPDWQNGEMPEDFEGQMPEGQQQNGQRPDWQNGQMPEGFEGRGGRGGHGGAQGEGGFRGQRPDFKNGQMPEGQQEEVSTQ